MIFSLMSSIFFWIFLDFFLEKGLKKGFMVRNWNRGTLLGGTMPSLRQRGVSGNSLMQSHLVIKEKGS